MSFLAELLLYRVNAITHFLSHLLVGLVKYLADQRVTLGEKGTTLGTVVVYSCHGLRLQIRGCE